MNNDDQNRNRGDILPPVDVDSIIIGLDIDEDDVKDAARFARLGTNKYQVLGELDRRRLRPASPRFDPFCDQRHVH